jgi:hypothetical protein
VSAPDDAPTMPSRSADVRSFEPDPADAGPAMRRALAALAPNEPGRVVVPTGNWVCREPLILARPARSSWARARARPR